MAAGLVKLALDKKTPHATREAAYRAVLDRAGLSPRQVLEHVGADGGPIQAQVIHMLTSARARLQVHEQQQLTAPTEPAPPKIDTE